MTNMQNLFTPSEHTDVLASLANCVSWMQHAAQVLQDEGLGATSRGLRIAAKDADAVWQKAMKELK